MSTPNVQRRAAGLPAQPTSVADELNAMRKIVNTLEKLDPEAQNRVLTWLDERFDQDNGFTTTPEPEPSGE